MTTELNKDRLFLVVGGGNGIGAQICRRLKQDGMKVAVADLDVQAAQRVAAELGDNSAGYGVDISDESAVKAMFAQVESEQGPVAGLICVAGLLIMPNGERPLIRDMTLDLWERTFAVNLRGAFLCSREYLQRRIEVPVDHGRVVFFGSVAAQLGGYRSSAAYIGAKAGLMGYAKAFAREAAQYGITANTIAPGLIDTDMLRITVASSSSLEEASKNIPAGRIGTVDDIAAAVSYLSSVDAGYVTGSVLDVNGGYRMQ